MGTEPLQTLKLPSKVDRPQKQTDPSGGRGQVSSARSVAETRRSGERAPDNSPVSARTPSPAASHPPEHPPPGPVTTVSGLRQLNSLQESSLCSRPWRGAHLDSSAIVCEGTLQGLAVPKPASPAHLMCPRNASHTA